MEQFATEEQQVEAIKKFWKEHGTAIIVGAIVSLGGLWGWRYYSDSQLAAREAASQEYQNALETFEQKNEVDALQSFISENSDNGYTQMANLMAASAAVKAGEFDKAKQSLNQVISNAQGTALADIAALRLARVQIETGELDAATSTLSTVTDETHAARVSELKGDILVLQNNFASAREAYSTALEKSGNAPILKMKLDNLAINASNAE